MKNFLRGLDWQTLAVLTALILVVGVVWRLNDAGRQIDALIAQKQQSDLTLQQHDAAAAADRATDQRNQKELVDYLEAVVEQQAAENAWLRSHHIPIPQRFVTIVPPPRIVVRHASHHRRAAHHVKRRATTSSSSTAPAGPGKSGSAPGHHKHPRHGHRHR